MRLQRRGTDHRDGLPLLTRLNVCIFRMAAYLSGKGAVYGAPDWQAEWNSSRLSNAAPTFSLRCNTRVVPAARRPPPAARRIFYNAGAGRFLPELQDSHGSQVLLPFVKSSERKRKAKAADSSRAAMLSKSLDQGKLSAAKRPPSASAQSILEKERAHNSRPHSAAKSVNQDALLVKEKHALDQEMAKKEGASRPQSREGFRPSSRGPPSRAQARPPSQADDSRPTSRSDLHAESGAKDAAGGGADTAPLAKSGTKQSLTAAAPLARTGTNKDLPAASPLAKSGTRKDLAGTAPLAKSGTKKDLTSAAGERRGVRGRRGSAAEAAAPTAGGGGGVDNAVVEAMQAELDAYKGAEARLKERLKDKDAQIHELTHKVFYLNDELNSANDR